MGKYFPFCAAGCSVRWVVFSSAWASLWPVSIENRELRSSWEIPEPNFRWQLPCSWIVVLGVTLPGRSWKMESDLRQVGVNAPQALTPGHEFIESVSPSMRSLVAVMLGVAQSEVPVLLLAEKGAGKTATAQRIHELSRRTGQWFRVLSCMTMEPGRGQDSAGETTLVGEGTIFLEELSELSAQGQSRLLQAMTEGSTNGSRAQRIARLICGSSCDLEAEVKAGSFREDLYYRLSGVCLRIPPLRQRRGGISSFRENFL